MREKNHNEGSQTLQLRLSICEISILGNIENSGQFSEQHLRVGPNLSER